jgi:catechol 2,3-dioxygenase-like lactoylglutathione lyase family enzyme
MPRALSVDHVQLAMPRGEEQSARDFYTGVLGLVEIPKPADLVARGGVWFRCGELQVHLGVENPFHPAKKAHPAFVVDDLAGFVSLLRGRGFPAPTQAEKIAGGARIFTEDPFGNRIELIQTRDSATL